jgi:hypothetical protein
VLVANKDVSCEILFAGSHIVAHVKYLIDFLLSERDFRHKFLPCTREIGVLSVKERTAEQ